MLIKIQSEDSYIFRKDQLVMDLYAGWLADQDIAVDLNLEANCAQSLGLYDILDRFCSRTSFRHDRITLITGNMVESHPRYKIHRDPRYWFEMPLIQQWAKDHPIPIENTPSKHFGNFVGQSRWYRLWLAAWLHDNFEDMTIQTFHGGLGCHYRTSAQDGVYDWIGLEDLNQFDCDIMPVVFDFLEHCPITPDTADVPANQLRSKPLLPSAHIPVDQMARVYMDLLPYYEYIFVDIVTETSCTGEAFMCTEKLWRCIAARRPFLVMSNRDYLHNLRRLGFKTFHDFWNEDYDGVSNQARICALQDVIRSISRLSLSDLHRQLAQMQPILDHNYHRFLSLSFDDIRKVFDV